MSMQRPDSTGPSCEVGPSLQGKCSRAGRQEHGEHLGKGREKVVSRAGLAFVCERSPPAIPAEALCFPFTRNTCLPCSEHRGSGDSEYVRGRGCYRKRRCPF